MTGLRNSPDSTEKEQCCSQRIHRQLSRIKVSTHNIIPTLRVYSVQHLTALYLSAIHALKQHYVGIIGISD